MMGCGAGCGSGGVVEGVMLLYCRWSFVIVWMFPILLEAAAVTFVRLVRQPIVELDSSLKLGPKFERILFTHISQSTCQANPPAL